MIAETSIYPDAKTEVSVGKRPVRDGAWLKLRDADGGSFNVFLTDAHALDLARKLTAYLAEHARVTVLVRTEPARVSDAPGPSAA